MTIKGFMFSAFVPASCRVRHLIAYGALLVLVGCGSAADNKVDGAMGVTTSTSSRLDIQDPVARLELARMTYAHGDDIHAEVVVSNDTGAGLDFRSCGGQPYWGVLDGGPEGIRGTSAQLTCMGEPKQIPEGESRFSVRVPTTYTSCTRDAISPELQCTQNGSLPDLPPGDYSLRIEGAGQSLPIPAPEIITLE
jgi:hypothetical protein